MIIAAHPVMNFKRRKIAVYCGALLSLFSGPAASDDYPVEAQENIRATAEQFVLTNTDSLEGRVEVKVGNLDSRLRLTACDQPLEGYDSPNGLNGGRGVVGVRCNGSKPWKLYVPVEVATYTEVAVLRHPIVRGQTLREDDVALDEVDVSRMKKAYYTRLDDVIGLRSKRPIAAGTTLHSGMLQRARLIKRGAQVQIVATVDGLHVTMSGKALSDGGLGDRIRVENNASGRVISGTVTNSGVIEVAN